MVALYTIYIIAFPFSQLKLPLHFRGDTPLLKTELWMPAIFHANFLFFTENQICTFSVLVNKEVKYVF